MTGQALRNIKATKKDVRNFGLLLGGALLGGGAFLLWKERGGHVAFFICGAAFALTGLFLPAVLVPLFKVWMLLAASLNWIMTRLILGLLFYLVVTPTGLVARLFGKRFLDTRFDPGGTTETYWNRRTGKPGRERYEQQF